MPQGSGLKRTGGPKRESRKRRAGQKVRRDLAGQWEGEACWLAIPGVCTGRAECWHELVAAGQGGSRVDPRNLCAADVCNLWIEDHPALAYRSGWKVRASDAVRGDGGLVPKALSPYSLAARQGHNGTEAA